MKIFLLVSFLFFECLAWSQPLRKEFLPEELRGVKLGMSEKKLLRKRGNMLEVYPEQVNFRKAYMQTNVSENVEYLVFFTDADGKKPLYEIIIRYKNIHVLDRFAAELLGEPNYEQTEWRYDTGKGFIVWAWKFENKLVLVGMIEDTEWDETKEKPPRESP
jgi:hypothetical protein